MRTRGRALLLIGALAFSLGGDASAQARSIRVRNFDALLTVHTDGSLDVTEQITVGFTGQWNGINRDLSLRHNTAQGRATKLDVTIGYVTDETGQRLQVEEQSQDNGSTRRLHIYIPGANNADRQVIIRYRVANAIRFFFANSSVGALDELYWNATGNNWSMFIDNAHARVVLPEGVAPTRTAVYTGALGSTSGDAKIEKVGNVVDFTLQRGLYPYEGMTIGVGWPAGHISSRPSETQERLATVAQWSPLLIPLIVFILAFKAWEKSGRDPEEGSYVVRYEPVAGTSPAELGTLVDNRADMDDITATLVDLAVRGFIRIEEVTESHLLGLSKSTDYIFHILRDRSQWTGLKPHEELYLSTLSTLAPIGETSVKVSELRNKFYNSLPAIRSAIYDSLLSSGFYRERPDKVKGKWVAFAALSAFVGIGLAVLAVKMMWVMISPFALIAGGVLTTIVLFVFAQIMPARTIAGARAREATLGFKEFLSRVEEERMKKLITSPEMFERFLPYAMAFGVADKWAKAFEDIYREPPTWYVGGSGQFSASSFSHSISTMSNAAASSMSSSPSSSGSGGGGSSGGGSGG
ncbi:MAG TPA: DUF2207 domain-containing protein, partial [Gemmatimonadaceae bacterium]|nr:DUF2207 domain-containing protein [Gemmatimonadaceae bacterium]